MADVTVTHQLGRDEALRRVKGCLDQKLREFGASADQQWGDGGGKIVISKSLAKVWASVSVASSSVTVRLDKLNMAAKMARQSIEDGLTDMLVAALRD